MFFFNAGDKSGEGDAHYNMSLAYEGDGDLEHAVEHMQQACIIHTGCFGADHAYVVDAQEEVLRLQQALQ